VSEWQDSAKIFGCYPIAVGEKPLDWHSDPLSGKHVPDPSRPWWEIPDFDPSVGDIKTVWELSRMDWVVAWAQQVRQGDDKALARLNYWLNDWCENNPPYHGPNWKCGQEASIRVMHLALAALVLEQVRAPASALLELVSLHLRRIAPTLSYAVGQDNNHGTSEAAALFIGGSWLIKHGVAGGEKWARTGRFWLENRVAKLIGVQGSFSQYSLNYHRVLLDTLCICEVWRRQLGLLEFSGRWQRQALVATQWLHHMINPLTGDGPNVGANDGARLLQLSDTVYRDYRPCVQLSMALFDRRLAYEEDGPWNHVMAWLDVPLPREIAPKISHYVADDGGFAVLRREDEMVMLRYPRFRFRPSQADALHLDYWRGDINLLLDGGSYSYCAAQELLSYFSGTSSHNTVQFDGREQMPRLGRFLFGDWLSTVKLEPLVERNGSLSFSARYIDGQGAGHCRSVTLDGNGLHVLDEINGFVDKAVLRWRLAPGPWQLEGCLVTDGTQSLLVQTSMPIVRCELVNGWESRHYYEKTLLPVLEIEVHRPGTLTTHYRRGV
jgi:hypothetical protein